MPIFDNIITGLKEFNANAWGYVAESLRENADEITSINTLRIYETGKDSEDKKLKNKYASYPVYSPGYEKKKKRLGLYNGHINLLLSGNYLGSYDLESTDKVVTIDVDPSNADLDQVLTDLYGLDIKGLSPKEWALVTVDFILPKLMDEFFKAFRQ